MKELTFLKEFILIKQVHQKSAIFVVFSYKGSTFQLYVSNRCHDLLMMSRNLRHIAILNIKDADYCCIIRGISKSETINFDLTKKSKT